MRTIQRLFLVILLTASTFSLGGCAVFGWFVAQFSPPQKVDAVYTPPSGKTILVFVDDLANPVSYEPIKAELTKRLNKKIIENEIAAEVVPYEELLNLMAATPGFNQLHIPTVGRKLDADLVLYVEIVRFCLKDNEVSPLWHGELKTKVKIVDSRQGRLWPDDRPGGYPVEPVETRPAENPSSSYGSELTEILAERMANTISQIFYDHKVSREMPFKD